MLYNRIGEVDIDKHVGESIPVIFIMKSIEINNQKDGKEYCRLVMKDKDKEIKAMIFGIDSELKGKLQEGKVYEAVIEIKDNPKYGLSCIIENKSLNKTNIDSKLFADWVEDLEGYVQKVTSLLGYVKGSIYGEIAYKILEKYWDKFCISPAGTNKHHTSFGGLLMHTACVAEGCLLEGSRYNKIYGENTVNLKLLVSGALLHDCMKVKEIESIPEECISKYSLRSALTTHVSDIDTEVVVTAIQLGYNYESEEVLELRHLVLSHHDKLEWGSPIVGHMIESKILTTIDNLDAMAWRFGKSLKGMESLSSKQSWSSDGLEIIYKGKGEGIDGKEDTR